MTLPTPVVYRLETPRLIIRAWAPTDAEELIRAETESRAHLEPWAAWARKIPMTVDETIDKLREWRAQIDRGENFRYVGIDKATNAMVGAVGMHHRAGVGGAEIGYWVHVDWINRGIATEMAGALTRVAFDVLGLRYVEIRTAQSNIASGGVPRKLGFVHEATLRERIETPIADQYDNSLIFCMLDKEYPSSHARTIELQASDAAGRRLAINNQ